ncbi:MAG: SCO family protein [Rhodanobacteraceae bacterium]
MSVFRTLLASLVILAAGVATLATATDGFRAFTTETPRRIAVSEHPRALPPVPLQTAGGQTIDFTRFRGRWLLVDFIYTRCMTYCSVQGTEFARLQARLAQPIAAGKVELLSISFDPARDGPAELAAYQQRSRDHGKGWIAARPQDARDLDALLRVFGVKAVPDALGGYVHNAAINVVDPEGRLVAVLDWDDPRGAARYVDARVRQP